MMLPVLFGIFLMALYGCASTDSASSSNDKDAASSQGEQQKKDSAPSKEKAKPVDQITPKGGLGDPLSTLDDLYGTNKVEDIMKRAKKMYQESKKLTGDSKGSEAEIEEIRLPPMNAAEFEKFTVYADNHLIITAVTVKSSLSTKEEKATTIQNFIPKDSKLIREGKSKTRDTEYELVYKSDLLKGQLNDDQSGLFTVTLIGDPEENEFGSFKITTGEPMDD